MSEARTGHAIVKAEVATKQEPRGADSPESPKLFFRTTRDPEVPLKTGQYKGKKKNVIFYLSDPQAHPEQDDVFMPEGRIVIGFTEDPKRVHERKFIMCLLEKSLPDKKTSVKKDEVFVKAHENAWFWMNPSDFGHGDQDQNTTLSKEPSEKQKEEPEPTIPINSTDIPKPKIAVKSPTGISPSLELAHKIKEAVESAHLPQAVEEPTEKYDKPIAIIKPEISDPEIPADLETQKEISFPLKIYRPVQLYTGHPMQKEERKKTGKDNRDELKSRQQMHEREIEILIMSTPGDFWHNWDDHYAHIRVEIEGAVLERYATKVSIIKALKNPEVDKTPF